MSKNTKTFEVLKNKIVIGIGAAYYQKNGRLAALTDGSEIRLFKTHKEAKEAATKFLK